MMTANRLPNHTMYLSLGRENSRFQSDSLDLPLTVGLDLSVVFALSVQMEKRVGKQKTQHPFNESAVVCAQGRHFKRAPLI